MKLKRVIIMYMSEYKIENSVQFKIVLVQIKILIWTIQSGQVQIEMWRQRIEIFQNILHFYQKQLYVDLENKTFTIC